jgi:DNA excision repair protein ERCC-4
MHVGIESEAKKEADVEDDSKQCKASGEVMMRRRLREYLDWKTSLSNVNRNLSSKPTDDGSRFGQSKESTGTPSQQQVRAPPNKRRRVRGGGTPGSAAARVPNSSVQTDVELPSQVTGLLDEIQPTNVEKTQKEEIVLDDLDDMEDYYELYDMDDLIVVHPFDGDMDEHILEEVRPRYIIMYEPDSAFIRRVEVYRSSHVGRNVRVYFIYYGGSVEEQRYLSAVRREKDSFTKLIKEKSVRHP